MSEVNEPALRVPHVLPVHDHGVTGRDGDASADAHVVVDQHRLRRARQSHDEALMRPRWAGLIGQDLRDAALRGDFDLRAMLREGALDRGIVRRRRGARGREEKREQQEGPRGDRSALLTPSRRPR